MSRPDSDNPEGSSPLFPYLPDPAVESYLVANRHNMKLPSLRNAVEVFRRDGRFLNRLALDPSEGKVLLDGRPMTDIAASALNVDLARAYDSDAATEAATLVATEGRRSE